MRSDNSKQEVRFLVELGKNLISLSAQKKKSLERLAYEAGVSKGYIYDIAKGHANPSAIILCRIATALDIPAWKLLKATS